MDQIREVNGNNYDNIFIKDSSDNLYICGNNEYGELGTEATNKLEQYFYSDLIKKYNVDTLYYGIGYTLFLDISNDLYVCGDNQYGQLGLGNDISRMLKVTKINKYLCKFGYKNIDIRTNFSVITTSDDKLYFIGENDKGQLNIDEKTSVSYLRINKDNIRCKKVICGNHAL